VALYIYACILDILSRHAGGGRGGGVYFKVRGTEISLRGSKQAASRTRSRAGLQNQPILPDELPHLVHLAGAEPQLSRRLVFPHVRVRGGAG
jgi:hypothetical protein